MEAVWRIEVEDFPAFIVVDDKGNDFFADTSKPTVQIGAGPRSAPRPARLTARDLRSQRTTLRTDGVVQDHGEAGVRGEGSAP